jgi:uncharacterized protein
VGIQMGVDMFLDRVLNLSHLLKKKSFFLFGPRGTGKTSLIKHQLQDVLRLDLLRSDLYMRLSRHPNELEEIILKTDSPKWVVIDEIQRIPMLLNEVHRLIEDRGIRFLLTGSSARKLKKNPDINMLGGRAWEANLFPLTREEIPHFKLDRYLQYGGIPSVYLSEEPTEELDAYANMFLMGEIKAEGLVRNIQAFSRFLAVSALTSGTMLNFSEIASDTGIPVSTVREYYQILEDTFFGFMLPAWTKSLKRKPISTAKFYLFDLGVKNLFAEVEQLQPKSDQYGQAFEHFIALELRAYLSYRRIKKKLSYWRTQHGHEVDFIIGNEIAIEVKTTKKVSSKHLKGLNLLHEEGLCQQYYLVSKDPIERKVGHCLLLHWTTFLDKLWKDDFLPK